jgi:hypothetical protein
MIQLLQENRRPREPKFSERLLSGLGSLSSEATSQVPRMLLGRQQERQENEALHRFTGLNLSSLTPDIKKEIVKSLIKRQETSDLKTAPLQSAYQRVQRMKELGQGGRLGRGSGILGFFGGERAKESGEYERLGKSLIQYATNIPIRNRSEFETLAHDLYDPTIPDSKREGILNAMEQIILDSLGEQGSVPMETRRKRSERPPLSSFGR